MGVNKQQVDMKWGCQRNGHKVMDSNTFEPRDFEIETSIYVSISNIVWSRNTRVEEVFSAVGAVIGRSGLRRENISIQLGT